MPKIEVKNLYKVFGSHPQKALDMLSQGICKKDILAQTDQNVAVDNVSFSVEKGEIFVLVGLSGSGKSTLLRCLNRLLEPTAGTILLDGQEISRLNDQEMREVRKNKMSMVFQHFGLLPNRTVLQNTTFGLEMQGISKPEREKRAREFLDLVGLAGWENKYPESLSGGMKQRVGIARALACQTEVLLMDEPFSALDPVNREALQEEMVKLQHQMDKTVVFITHDMKEAGKLGDKIAFVKEGALVQVGSAQEIIHNPKNDYVARFTQGLEGGEAHVPTPTR